MQEQLCSENEQFIEQSLVTGQYASRDEVLDDAVSLLRRRQMEREQLIRDVNFGIQQLERGEGAESFGLGHPLLLARAPLRRVPNPAVNALMDEPRHDIAVGT